MRPIPKASAALLQEHADVCGGVAGSAQQAHVIDQTVAGEPIDGNRVYVSLGSPGDPLFVDHERPNTNAPDHLGMHVWAGREEATVLLAHRRSPAHHHAALRVLNNDVVGVAGDKAV